jgi:molecular chaperone DnaK
MSFAVGIDLGTTNSVVAAVRDGVATPLADPQGFRLIPSVVSFPSTGAVLVGRAAIERRVDDPGQTVYSVKRLIGRPWNTPEVQKVRDTFPFDLREAPGGGVGVAVHGTTYTLPEISAFVLRQCKAVAEAALGGPVLRAVVTVPANFNDLQRSATKTAASLAGLQVLRILNEPTAAALAHGPSGKARERIAIYDFGGGTFDITILEIADGVLEVLATAGDTQLGGDDIDAAVAERMAEDIFRKHKVDARADTRIFDRLRVMAEKLKRELSTRSEVEVTGEAFGGDRSALARWVFRMTRQELEQTSLGIVDRTFSVCRQALDAAKLQLTGVDRIVLVGGSTRMPLVARRVEQSFGRRPVARIHPELIVALGASIQASLLDDEQPLAIPTIDADCLDVEPQDIEVLAAPQPPQPPPPPPRPRPPLAPTSRAPRAEEARPSAASRVPSAEALPAASPRASRAEEPSVPRRPVQPAAAPPPPPEVAPVLIDVTPLSLNVETAGGFCSLLIEANTPIPCECTRTFTTGNDGQSTVCVRVAQGPSARFAENTCLGEVELSGIEPAPRGTAQIAVTFEIDADGIMNVCAKDIKSGRQKAARVQIVGTPADAKAIEAMRARQQAHPIADLSSQPSR